MQFFFENHVLDIDRRELRRGPTPITVGPQVFDLLVYLVRNRDRVVSKDDLITNVWGGRIVSDSNLDSRITAARKAIGDNGTHQSLIRTLPRKGVRFVGAVTEAMAPEPLKAAEVLPLDVDRPIFAVLPFQNLSDDPSQEYLADGISEDLIAAISGWCRYPVIARNSSFTYKGRIVDIKIVGKALGARYVLDGSVRKSGQRVRIAAQLTDAATGHHLWADRYDREISDIFTIQDEITAAIAAAIEPELCEIEERRASQALHPKLAAYDLVQRGNWHHYRFTPAEAEEAQRLFAAAIEADPDYAPAYACMAYTIYWTAQMRWAVPFKETLQKAREFARKAVAIDERDAKAHMYLGSILLWLRQHDEAEQQVRRAIELNPSLAQAYSVLGYTLDSLGQFRAAQTAVTRSLYLRPRDRTLARCLPALSVAHYQLNEYEQAAEVAQRSITINPVYWMGHQLLAASFGQLGRRVEAEQSLAEIRRREPTISCSEYSAKLPFRERVYTERIEQGLIKAGWRD